MAALGGRELVDLPDDVLVYIACFFDTADRVRFAACCQRLRRIVFSTPQLWHTITIHRHHAAKITDFMLGALLKRCNARMVLRRLSLNGCVKVQGEGLRSIVGEGDSDSDSDGDVRRPVLEWIDLRLVCPPDWRPHQKTTSEVVAPFLMQCPRLAVVLVTPTWFDDDGALYVFSA